MYDYYHKNNSIMYIYKDGEVYKKIMLDSKAHCGGISYDEKTNSIFLTGIGEKNHSYVHKYELDYLLNEFNELWNEMKNRPLPQTRQEFEDRAELFTILHKYSCVGTNNKKHLCPAQVLSSNGFQFRKRIPLPVLPSKRRPADRHRTWI